MINNNQNKWSDPFDAVHGGWCLWWRTLTVCQVTCRKCRVFCKRAPEKNTMSRKDSSSLLSYLTLSYANCAASQTTPCTSVVLVLTGASVRASVAGSVGPVHTHPASLQASSAYSSTYVPLWAFSQFFIPSLLPHVLDTIVSWLCWATETHVYLGLNCGREHFSWDFILCVVMRRYCSYLNVNVTWTGYFWCLASSWRSLDWLDIQ